MCSMPSKARSKIHIASRPMYWMTSSIAFQNVSFQPAYSGAFVENTSVYRGNVWFASLVASMRAHRNPCTNDVGVGACKTGGE